MALLLLTLGTVVFVNKTKVYEMLQVVLEWIRLHDVLGPIILILVYVAATVAFIPGTLLTLGAGWAFEQAYGKFWLAYLIAVISVLIGA